MPGVCGGGMVDALVMGTFGMSAGSDESRGSAAEGLARPRSESAEVDPDQVTGGQRTNSPG